MPSGVVLDLGGDHRLNSGDAAYAYGTFTTSRVRGTGTVRYATNSGGGTRTGTYYLGINGGVHFVPDTAFPTGTQSVSVATAPGVGHYMGSDGNDKNLTGTSGADIIYGGNTASENGTCDDTISAGTGNDVVFAGDGADWGFGGDGNDTVYGGSGNDFIDGGAGDNVSHGGGDDSITGGLGNDSIYGGIGNDVLHGDAGDDMLYGGDGSDAIFGELGNDTILSGDGIDVLTGNDGSNVISGDAGDDTLYGGAGNNSLQGGSGADTLFGGTGNDSLGGGDGNDVLNGEDGNHILSGGDGDDIIDGGRGAESLIGGAGSDTLTFGRGDTVDAGADDDQIILTGDEDGNPVDITVNGGDGYDTLQLGKGAVWSTLTPSTPDQSNSGTVQLDDGSLLAFSNIENIICFTPGTRIATPHGARDIATLKVGDLVMTRDHGLRPIRWIQQRTVPAHGRFAPIRIRPGVITGLDRDLVVSPQHRMLFQGDRAELLFGESEVLVPAEHLVDGLSVTQDERDTVTYVHMMFDTHEVVYAEGAATESFHPGSHGLDTIHDAAREELFTIFPDLRSDVNRYGDTARRCLRRHEAELLRV